MKFFRSLGGSESATWAYTEAGYKVVKLVSTSPNKQQKTIREFTFHYLDWRQREVYKSLLKETKDGLFYLKRFKRGLTIDELKKVLTKKSK